MKKRLFNEEEARIIADTLNRELDVDCIEYSTFLQPVDINTNAVARRLSFVLRDNYLEYVILIYTQGGEASITAIFKGRVIMWFDLYDSDTVTDLTCTSSVGDFTHYIKCVKAVGDDLSGILDL